MFEKKNVFIINICLVGLITALDIMYMLMGGLWLKSITSLVFVVAGVTNLLFAIKQKTELKFPIILCVALAVAMLGDVIINIEFMAGAIIFAIGHVFYFVAYCMLNKFALTDLIYVFALAVPSMLIVLFAPGLDYGGSIMKVICAVYALIISFMVGKAAANMVKDRSISKIVIFTGSLLFFISDLMLLLDVFGSITWAVYICLITYYIGQITIVFGMYLWVKHYSQKV